MKCSCGLDSLRLQDVAAHDEKVAANDLAVARGHREVAFLAIANEAHGPAAVLSNCGVDEVVTGARPEWKDVGAIARSRSGGVGDLPVPQ